MTETQEIPTETGYYWVRHVDADKEQCSAVVWVDVENSTYSFSETKKVCSLDSDLSKSGVLRWQGPLKP